MRRLNPLVKGRMYKVAGGGPVRGIRFNKNGTTDILVVPGSKKRNPKRKAAKKKRSKKKPNRKRKTNRKRTVKRFNRKRAAKKKK